MKAYTVEEIKTAIMAARTLEELEGIVAALKGELSKYSPAAVMVIVLIIGIKERGLKNLLDLDL